VVPSNNFFSPNIHNSPLLPVLNPKKANFSSKTKVASGTKYGVLPVSENPDLDRFWYHEHESEYIVGKENDPPKF
jgi:hypothetical protein